MRAHSRVSRRNLMRVDEGRNSWSLLAMTTKPRAVVGRGGKSLVSGPRSGLPLGRGKEKETCEDTTVGGASKEEKKKEVGALSFSAKTRQWHRSSLRTTATWTRTLQFLGVSDTSHVIHAKGQAGGGCASFTTRFWTFFLHMSAYRPLHVCVVHIESLVVISKRRHPAHPAPVSLHHSIEIQALRSHTTRQRFTPIVKPGPGTSTRAGVLYDICNVFRLIVDSGGGAVIVHAAVIGSNQTQFRRVSVFNTVHIAKPLPPPCTEQR